ncbi:MULTISPECIES: PLP-dependent aminotransferase family protein [unclassified Paenibacillus]|uniref:aminotransferase-like domain-containing protein n=1 Tax=unclassified Paenibacillus TaxID=185978 RepID=UPI002405CC79|nr:MULTISPECIES: PLP-dependent aminotransferase family protein [unclassified Paenibacillus]MDF9844192.1 2-aminoadipate transaminase [Paenibacillus sp. PastF-2]MDF9850797.1 2-aminoadipate transaminase [Paenibacillus sp. PastM-2]MDF9857440.1 2-aminoadipate transaminase [Paenibacillus sp. PastF-1]MDH6482708.1 2-aminoadipate transaminase [Paenibacillus sp. PastH-2]MDH6510062.1 2-aminoadipate transaminase [Paenibacillus sp. PastM-3]
MKYEFSARAHTLVSSPQLSIRTQTRRGTLISLAEELPAEELFPLSLLAEAASTVITADAGALQYGDPEGYAPLREWLTDDWLKGKGVNTAEGGVLLTTGSQQAIDLLSRVYIDPGDRVLVENPTSPGILQALRMQGAVIIPVHGDRNGLLPDHLRTQIHQHRPKMLFATPSYTNPSGILWSLERRKEVLELCTAHNLLIVEDDSYGDLHFKRAGSTSPVANYPSLYALENVSKGGHVLYIGSFSKTVAPALRTGWAAGSRELISMMAAAKQMADWQSSSLNQRLLHYLLDVTAFNLREHIAVLNREYSTRLKLMTELLKRPAWKNSEYDLPEGGMFLWVSLPEGLDAMMLLKAALAKGVAFLPGQLCSVSGGGNRIRLNFSHPGRDELLLGMNLMSEAVTEFTARS